MADIILLDGRGEPATYSGVTVVEFDTVDGGRAQFHNLKISEADVDLDFSETEQMQIEPEAGEVFQKVRINKPDNLQPENIFDGVEIAGVVGTLKGGGGADELIDGSATEVTSSATSVAPYTFYERKSLTRAHFPKAKVIGTYAFRGCDSLVELNIPEATTIGPHALSHCSSLTDLCLPNARDIGYHYGLSNLQNVYLGETLFTPNVAFASPEFPNAFAVPIDALRSWQLYAKTTPFKQYSDKNVMRHVCDDVSGQTLTMSIYAEEGETVVAVMAARDDVTLPDGWTLLREAPVVGTVGQRLLFAYTDVAETGAKEYTFTLSSSTRIYIALIAFKNVKSLKWTGEYYLKGVEYKDDSRIFTKDPTKKLIWGCACSYWSGTEALCFWDTSPADATVVQRYNAGMARVGAILDFGNTTQRTISANINKNTGESSSAGANDIGIQFDAIEVEFYEEG